MAYPAVYDVAVGPYAYDQIYPAWRVIGTLHEGGYDAEKKHEGVPVGLVLVGPVPVGPVLVGPVVAYLWDAYHGDPDCLLDEYLSDLCHLVVAHPGHAQHTLPSYEPAYRSAHA